MKRKKRPDPEPEEYADQFVDLEKFIESVRKLIGKLAKATVPVSRGTAYGCRLAIERLAVVPVEAPDSWSNVHAYAAYRRDLIDLTDTAVGHLANRLSLDYSKLNAGDPDEWQKALKGQRLPNVEFPKLSPAMAAFGSKVEEQLGRLKPKPTPQTPLSPSTKQLDRVREAIKATGKNATPLRVLTELRGDNSEGKGMRNTTFDHCLRILAGKGEYKGHKRSLKKRSS